MTGVYEGGLKIWECSIDLASFVASGIDVKSLNVLELGCGAGLPGIVAGQLGATRTDFQVKIFNENFFFLQIVTQQK